MHEETKEIIEKILLHGSLGFGGGAANYLWHNNQPRWLQLLTAGLASSFTGVVFGLVASCFTESQYMISAVAGIGGYSGSASMEWLFLVLRRIVDKRV